MLLLLARQRCAWPLAPGHAQDHGVICRIENRDGLRHASQRFASSCYANAMLASTTLLSVNLNKIAVLRNSRGGERPDLRSAAETVIAAGCGGITVHPRPDQRHIRPDDVLLLAELCRDRVEFNIEGNPFAPERGDYPGLLALAERTRPTQVTFVPDGDGQITSDHGFDLARDGDRLVPLIRAYTALGCRVSLFMDCDAP